MMQLSNQLQLKAAILYGLAPDLYNGQFMLRLKGREWTDVDNTLSMASEQKLSLQPFIACPLVEIAR